MYLAPHVRTLYTQIRNRALIQVSLPALCFLVILIALVMLTAGSAPPAVVSAVSVAPCCVSFSPPAVTKPFTSWPTGLCLFVSSLFVIYLRAPLCMHYSCQVFRSGLKMSLASNTPLFRLLLLLDDHFLTFTADTFHCKGKCHLLFIKRHNHFCG